LTNKVIESAAEALYRPLYYISGAELGLLGILSGGFHRLASIKDKLGLIFKRVARWEAILLFNEANTFITSRGDRDNDGKRNALISSMPTELLYSPRLSGYEPFTKFIL
jgi:hypothetical protein